ncbi:unnamed protein product [Callosobruchus maculatus]|uniref:Uncharacterized protein n=1 Tax=Callosobruchus maculatus TaxID=64391 RepID=A0A653DVT4_CALMS|nr:unnamed protein product [Callosobruchus maculatus]
MEAPKHYELRGFSQAVQRLKDWSSGWWLTASENLACIKNTCILHEHVPVAKEAYT